MRDGLSSRQVYELEGDGDGFVWMYTNSGFERYDGYRFKHYQLVQREEKIDHITSATTMQRGADGSLWIAVKSGKIYSYCKQSDRFVKRVDFNDRTIDIYHFALLPDGKIAVGTSKGLYIATPGAIPQRIALDGILLMPKMRGDELCRYIKTDIATSHIPVILLSGLAERSDVVSGLDAQADDYVVKPFDVVVLKARIRNIFKNRQQLSREVLADDNKPEEVEYTNELDRQFMVKAMEILNENLAESEFSVVDLCAAIGMSRTSVYNKIRSITGQSVNEFIRIVRLNKSKELLSTKMYNVSEVAYMVGFSDPKYFSTCFKKQFGVSPSKFTLNG